MRILKSLDDIEAKGVEYVQCAESDALAALALHTHCGIAEKDDLVDLYNAKFVPAASPGRDVYTTIRQSATRNKCPLCSQLTVATLDHYLPKAKYPAFSVFPLNLVPSCSRCNIHKMAKAEALTLHPYYDRLESVLWLKCSLLDEGAVSLAFGVYDNIEPLALRRRMLSHLSDVGVGELYQASALSHLADIRHRLCSLGSTGGNAAVQAYLEEEYESRLAYQLNSWSTALYFALKSTDWFVQGGYARIDHA